MVMTEPSRCSSRTEASIPRASSNLELLSQTAAWKNDLENPARVSPSTEIAAQTPSIDLVSPKYCNTVDSSSFETSPSQSIGCALDGRSSSPFACSLPSSSSWVGKWSSMMFPINNESSNSFDEKNQEHSDNSFPASSSSAFCRHPQAVHAAFAPPVSSRNNRKRTSTDESDSSNKRLVISASPDGSRVSVTTTTTTVIRQPGSALLQPRFNGRSDLHSHGSLSSNSGSTTPPFVIEPAAARGGSWTTSWTHPPSGSNQQQVLDELARDNALLRYELGERSRLVDTLQQTIEDLQSQVDELRQLPVGKISQIPVA